MNTIIVYIKVNINQCSYRISYILKRKNNRAIWCKKQVEIMKVHYYKRVVHLIGCFFNRNNHFM